MTNPKISVVVLNYKNHGDTIECLHSLARVTYPNVEIVVVDNDSQDDSLTHIRHDLAERQVGHEMLAENQIDCAGRISQKTILLQSRQNRGFAAGNNLGIRVALARAADYVLILNNDTVVEPSFLEPLVEYAEAHAQVGAVGPKVVDPEGRIDASCARRQPTPLFYFFVGGMGRRLFPGNRWIRRHTYQGEYAFDRPKEVELLSGCCLMLKSGVFHALGLLDENTFLFHEEQIICDRLRGLGMTSVVVPGGVIVHKHGRSTGRVPAAFVRKASRDSLRYYLRQYRHYNRFQVAAIMLLRSSPMAFLRKGRNAR